MRTVKFCIYLLILCIFLTACGKAVSYEAAAEETAAEKVSLNYGQIESDFSGLTPGVAAVFLGIVDDLSSHLGYDEAEASGGEYLQGGFVRDWNGDGMPELCLLLKTSPRENGSWDGTPLYGWYSPTLYLYTVQSGQAVLAGNCDLYFATAGREAAVAAFPAGNSLQLVRWDRSDLVDETYLDCFELRSGALQQTDVPANVAAASQGAETAQMFLDVLAADGSQLLLYNCSGEAKIEGEANARLLRAVLAEKAA